MQQHVKRLATAGGLLAAVALVAGCAGAGPTPTEEPAVESPVEEFIIAYAPGGSTDVMGRAFVDAYNAVHDVNVKVTNVDGAGGTIGIGQVVTSKPDGETIGMGSLTGLSAQPLVGDLPYKTSDDYVAYASLGSFPGIYLVAADSEWEDFQDVIDHLKDHPGDVNIGSGGAFGFGDLLTEQLYLAAGLEFTNAVLGGGSEIMAALLGGQVDGFLTTMGTARSFIKDGSAKALLVMSNEKPVDPDLAGVPILPDYDIKIERPIELSYFVIGPKGVEPSLEAAISNAVAEAIESDEYRAFQKAQAITPGAVGLKDTVAELRAYDDIFAKLKKSLEDRGLL